MPAKTWQDALIGQLDRMEKAIKAVDEKLDGHVGELNKFQIQYAREMAQVQTQIKIYAAIAAGIGTLLGGIAAKYLFPGHL